MFRKTLMLVPALALAAPAVAGTNASYEALRAPAGKTVTLWRHVDRPATTAITCPHDNTKAFWCQARKAELSAQKTQQLTER